MVNTDLRQAAPGWIAPGGRVYAIGDVHGCARRLQDLHGLVATDLAADPVARPLLLHIGDYIDRGPDSAGVIDLLAAGSQRLGCPTVNLRGNHEQMLLDAVTGDRAKAAHWLDNNADSTLRSWGSSARRPVREWREAIGAANLDFLDALPLTHALDGYLFVHAGVRPGAQLARQTSDDLLWIREGFLDWDGPLLADQPQIAVVHGHTPRERPTVARHRIGIDTGAVNGGALTCAVLEGRTVRFLQA